jgi:hypothetical protein
MTDLTNVLESMHNDAVIVLRQQLAAIDEQERDRLRIDSEIKRQLDENIGEVRADELRVTADSELPDAERQARVLFLFKRLDLINRLSDEMRHCWNDYQRLEEQRREIERELTVLAQQAGRADAA